MKEVYGYTRVSTIKQGNGVSLAEQKEAIARYAARNNLIVTEWFEEKETAAKQGRQLFSAMMKKLKKRLAAGVIIHKIDRGARNLRDWTDLGELADDGIEIHFAHESLDMQARSGRLSADIQAVIASDYIRNLRQETIKGIYGRLKQGIYPFQAPIGYRDTGPGKPKAVDALNASIVKRAFELYASRRYTINSLLPVLHGLGLRNTKGSKLSFNSLAAMLHNKFYVGIIKVKGQTFKGAHEPIVTSVLYDQVQNVFKTRSNEKIQRHEFLFRKRVRCSGCNSLLTGEIQKGHIYYRCHTKGCPTKGLRESHINRMLVSAFSRMQFSDGEEKELHSQLNQAERDWLGKEQEMVRLNEMQLGNLNSKLERLTDAYLENLLDKETYGHRKERLLEEIVKKEEVGKQLLTKKQEAVAQAKQFFELAKSLKTNYETAENKTKLDLLETITSNLSVFGKKLEITMFSPFQEMFFKQSFLFGSPILADPRKDDTRIAITEESLAEPAREYAPDELRAFIDYVFTYYATHPDGDALSALTSTDKWNTKNPPSSPM